MSTVNKEELLQIIESIECGYCCIFQGQLLVVMSALTMFARSESDTGLEDILGKALFIYHARSKHCLKRCIMQTVPDG